MNNHAIYAFAKVETWLENYAKSHDMPSSPLICEVASMLANGGVQSSSPRRISTPRAATKKIRGAKSYWDKLTPEERSAEIIRRQAVAEKNKAAKKRPAGGVA